MNVQEVFAPGGPLATAAGIQYEVREGQITMAMAIDELFDRGGVLLVEAPTGSGKSVSYFVPAIRQVATAKPQRKVVVVTANIALQEQLITKDLPTLQAALPEWPFTFALAKGIGNFLCLEKWQDAIAESIVGKNRGSQDEDEAWPLLEAWVQTTVDGDLSELPVELPPRVRLAVTTTADDCTGKKCSHYGACHGMEARRRAAAAQIVVTNYHLFFADLAIKSGGDDVAGILPAYDFVIADECHNMASITADFFGWRITMGMIRWAIRMLRPDAQAPVYAAAERFFRDVGRGPEPKGVRLKPRITKPGEVDGTLLSELLLGAADRLGSIAATELIGDVKAKLTKCENRCRELAFRLLALARLDEAQKLVYFGEPPTTPTGYWSIGMKPLDVNVILQTALFESKSIKAIVGTSATLTVAGNFDYIIGQIGAYKAEELIVPSPFNHDGAAVLVVPGDLPDPKHSLFAERVAEIVDETIRAARGRTLALFTSYRVLEHTYRYLMGKHYPYRILKQGDRPRTQLIAEFRRDVDSVLLGTDSFWEGIDVQGEALSAVVIDRLPFQHPDDPVFEAICERDPRGWFMREALPRSIIEFRQGFGRLIRSRTDRGAIVVCDRRIIEKPYGVKYLRSLPAGVTLHRTVGAVAQILGT